MAEVSTAGLFSSVAIQFGDSLSNTKAQNSDSEKTLTSKVEIQKTKALGELKCVFNPDTSPLIDRVRASNGSLSFFQCFILLKILRFPCTGFEYISVLESMISRIKSGLFPRSDMNDFIQKVLMSSEMEGGEKRKLLSAVLHSILNVDMFKFFSRDSVQSDYLTVYIDEFEKIMSDSTLAPAGRLVINGISCEPPFSELGFIKLSNLSLIKEFRISGTQKLPSPKILKLFPYLSKIVFSNHFSISEFNKLHEFLKKTRYQSKLTISIPTTEIGFLELDIKNFELKRVNFIIDIYKDGNKTGKVLI